MQTLEIIFQPMALEQQTFPVGSTIRVTVSFQYVVGVNTTVQLMAGPYYTNLFGKHLVSQCMGKTDVQLTAASTPADKTATVDFTLVPKANGGIDNGTYGLRVWVEGTQALADEDNMLVVTGNPGGSTDMFSSMMPMLMMLMMLGMVMPMMQSASGGSEEEAE